MILTRRLQLKTQGDNDVLNVTGMVEAEVAASGVRDGTATLFLPGSTAGLTTVEYEPGLVSDLREAFDRLVPRALVYRHNLSEGDDNGHSHVRASLLGPSLVIPFEGGRMVLGTWQQIVMIDFDVRPRSRELVVQIAGS
jgi:secondary thiamine-phosphate synthase enzyme